jgi:hypothetical protein
MRPPGHGIRYKSTAPSGSRVVLIVRMSIWARRVVCRQVDIQCDEHLPPLAKHSD